MNRRLFIGTLLAAALAVSPAAAITPQAYTAQAFGAAQAAGKPILLHITASWCPTCRAQKPILSMLEAEPKFKELVTFDIDFDTSKALLRQLRVSQQSTMIVYKGKQEVARSTGDTDASSIEALLDKAL